MVRRGDDGGQMLLLAGFILVLAFVVTALTLTEVADLEKRVAESPGVQLTSEFRFVREKVGTTLAGALGVASDNTTFDNTFLSMQSTFKNVEHEKGLDVAITLAGANANAPSPESSFVAAGAYDELRSWDNAIEYDGARYDGTDDGILWTKKGRCSTTATGCVSGAVIHIFLTDGVTTIRETVVYAINPAT
jgi:hypothetical protein